MCWFFFFKLAFDIQKKGIEMQLNPRFTSNNFTFPNIAWKPRLDRCHLLYQLIFTNHLMIVSVA